MGLKCKLFVDIFIPNDWLHRVEHRDVVTMQSAPWKDLINIVACYLVTRQIACVFWNWHSVYWDIHQAELQLVASQSYNTKTSHFDSSVRASSSLSTELISTLDWTDPWLSVSSVSHPLKLILCRLEREYLFASFNFLFYDESLLVTAECHC
jgi:hypothetical protein